MQLWQLELQGLAAKRVNLINIYIRSESLIIGGENVGVRIIIFTQLLLSERGGEPKHQRNMK